MKPQDGRNKGMQQPSVVNARRDAMPSIPIHIEVRCACFFLPRGFLPVLWCVVLPLAPAPPSKLPRTQCAAARKRNDRHDCNINVSNRLPEPAPCKRAPCFLVRASDAWRGPTQHNIARPSFVDALRNSSLLPDAPSKSPKSVVPPPRPAWQSLSRPRAYHIPDQSCGCSAKRLHLCGSSRRGFWNRLRS